jgi:hypothetical protein
VAGFGKMLNSGAKLMSLASVVAQLVQALKQATLKTLSLLTVKTLFVNPPEVTVHASPPLNSS